MRPAPAGPRPATISSLRQYGKVHQLTAYGSVFNAENLIKVARLEGAKGHRGIYDGHVITTTDPNDHVKKVKGLIDQECPVIVPFDVGLGGEPDHEGKGKAAHWAAIFGYYRDGPTDYFIHYHWGFYRYSPAQDLARSTHNLTSNVFLMTQKMEVIVPRTGEIVKRDYIAVRRLKDYKGYRLRRVGSPVQNAEFTNPAAVDMPLVWEEANEVLRRHGFDPKNVTNAGLKDKLVAIYPTTHRPIEHGPESGGQLRGLEA